MNIRPEQFEKSTNLDLLSKDEEEALKIRAERKALIAKTRFEIVRLVALLIGSVALFIVVTRPEFILNKKVSEEQISMERAKLILQLIQEKDPRKVSLGLSVIEASYPSSEEEWFVNLKEVIMQESSSIEELINQYKQLIEERKIIEQKMEDELLGRKTDFSTGKAGYGRQYRFLYEQYVKLDQQIDRIEDVLKRFGAIEAIQGSVIY